MGQAEFQRTDAAQRLCGRWAFLHCWLSADWRPVPRHRNIFLGMTLAFLEHPTPLVVHISFGNSPFEAAPQNLL